MGASEELSKEGNRAQTFLQRKRAFHLYIDPKGKGDWKEPEVFTLDVKGSSLENIRIIAPSLVSKNKRFDVIIRFEDCYGNLTHQAPEGTLIELSYKNLRENLNWKLFVPETGFINIPNLYFGESGIYRIELRNLTTKEVFYSSPIKCSTDSDADKSIFGDSYMENPSDLMRAIILKPVFAICVMRKTFISLPLPLLKIQKKPLMTYGKLFLHKLLNLMKT